MARVYVDFTSLKSVTDNITLAVGKIHGVRDSFTRTTSALDWDIKFERDISNTANRLTQKLNDYERALSNYKTYIDVAVAEYAALDGYAQTMASSPQVTTGSLITNIGNAVVTGYSSTKSWLAEKFGEGGALYTLGKYLGAGLTALNGVIQVAGGAAMIATGNPLGVLLILNGISVTGGGVLDLYNTYTENYGDIGRNNVLNNFIVGTGEYLGEQIGGERGKEIGGLLGTSMYAVGNTALSFAAGGALYQAAAPSGAVHTTSSFNFSQGAASVTHNTITEMTTANHLFDFLYVNQIGGSVAGSLTTAQSYLNKLQDVSEKSIPELLVDNLKEYAQ